VPSGIPQPLGGVYALIEFAVEHKLLPNPAKMLATPPRPMPEHQRDRNRLAEDEGFEPSRGCPNTLFKSAGGCPGRTATARTWGISTRPVRRGPC
jgi:hypothetical protein